MSSLNGQLSFHPNSRLDPSLHQASSDELHIALAVPRHTARLIFQWARQQDWPPETKLQHPGEYHITLLHAASGHDYGENAWWNKEIGQLPAKVESIQAFPASNVGGYAYVLVLDAPDIEDKATEMQARAQWMGLPVSIHPDGFKPHLTIGYGPTSRLTGVIAPDFQFDVGPSSVSPKIHRLDGPRGDIANQDQSKQSAQNNGKFRLQNTSINYRPQDDEGHQHEPHYRKDLHMQRIDFHTQRIAYDPDAVKALDHLSLASVAHNLHYRFEQGGLDPAEATNYVQQLLQLIGYPINDLNTQAALQSWRQLYPQDQMLDAAPQMSQVPEKFAATRSELSQTLRYSTPRLYHWLDASDVHDWMDNPRDQHHLTKADRPELDPAIPRFDNPVRLSIDNEYLDPNLFDGVTYHGPIHPDAVTEIKSFKPADNYSTVPTQVNNPEDHWPEFGEQPPDRHHDIEFSNDWTKGSSWDPAICERCGSPMSEPIRRSGRFVNHCLRCGLSREVPSNSPLLKIYRRDQELTPYPAMLQDVGPQRPWVFSYKGD